VPERLVGAQVDPRVRPFSTKRAFALHGRLGVWLAAPLAFVLLTGSLAVFAPELDALFYPCVRCETARRGELDVPWSRLEENARHVLPSALPLVLNAPEEDGRSAWALVEIAPRDYRHVFFDPHDGRVLGVGAFRMPRRLLRDLHRSWLLGENVGLFLVTSLALFLATSIASGLRFWSPRGPRAPLRFGHRVVSAVMLPFLALLVTTGVWYWSELVFGWADLHPSGDVPRMQASDVARLREGEPIRDVDALVAVARGVWPELEIHAVAYPTVRRPTFSVFGTTGETGIVRDLANQVFVHPYDGSVMGVSRADELSGLGWWEHVVDAIHFGTWGGVPSRIAYVAFGLLAMSLPISGALIRRRRLRG
jgi:uncharacterized iron-regulated membrane protein